MHKVFNQEAGDKNKGMKYLCWTLIGIGVYTILPFLLLAKYNQPAADDFTLAVRDRVNPLSVVLKDVYFNWSGRYLAPVISRLNPLIYDPALYKLYSIVLVVGFVLSVIILVREFFKHTCSCTEVLSLSSLFIYIVFSQTPSISEAFYWFSGSCIYQTANIATLLLLTVLCRMNRATNLLSKNVYTLLAGVLCIFIIGCNEISMMIVCIIVFFATVYSYQIHGKTNFRHSIVCVVCVLCSGVVFFSPGNFSRVGDPMFYNKSALWTVVGATSATFLYVLKWATSLIAATLVYAIFRLKTHTTKPTQKQTTNSSIKTYAIIFIAIFILLQIFVIYATGGGNLGRIENDIYLLVLIAYFFILHLFLSKYLFSKIFQIVAFKFFSVVSIALFLFNVFDVENNISSAYIDLFSGRAKKYNEELNDRLILVRNCKHDTCYVPALTSVPKSLFVTDIRTADDSIFLWINRGYAAYYHTSYILPSASLPLVEPNIEILKHLGKEIRKNVVNK